jgi:hypothetical protein
MPAPEQAVEKRGGVMAALLRIFALMICPVLGWLLGYGAGAVGSGLLGWGEVAAALVPGFVTGPLVALVGVFGGLWLALRET